MLDPSRFIFQFLIEWWWTFTPIVLFFILFNLWMLYIQTRYQSRIIWNLLEIRLPREVLKSPKAMEQAFANLHGVYSKPNLIEKYIDGHTPPYFSFEMAGIEGETHFFLRTQEKYRNFAESQIYAQYPEAEIDVIEDYVDLVPPSIPDKDYELWGTDMILTKPDAYPIRTYIYFEDQIEEKRLDPLSSLAETFSRLKKGEQIWVQMVIAPVLDGWREEGERLVAKLIGKTEAVKKGFFEEFFGAFIEMIGTLISGRPSSPPVVSKGDMMTRMMYLSPGERETVMAIEQNISKLGFRTLIRFLYVAPKDLFTKANVAAMLGVFKQFNTQHLNGFQHDSSKAPSIDYLFKKTRNYLRKRSLFDKFKKRSVLGSKRYILNIEELATVYHIPGIVVSAPLMPRIEAKKGEPPSTLPVE